MNMVLVLIWAALCAFFVYTTTATSNAPDAVAIEGFRLSLTSSLPIVSLILYWLARRGIISDEKLVRAADRIR